MNDVAAPAPQSWKVTLPCTRAEAEALDGDIAAFALMEHPPVLMTSEAEDDESVWRLDAYFEGKPGPAAIKLRQTLATSQPMPSDRRARRCASAARRWS